MSLVAMGTALTEIDLDALRVSPNATCYYEKPGGSFVEGWHVTWLGEDCFELRKSIPHLCLHGHGDTKEEAIQNLANRMGQCSWDGRNPLA